MGTEQRDASGGESRAEPPRVGAVERLRGLWADPLLRFIVLFLLYLTAAAAAYPALRDRYHFVQNLVFSTAFPSQHCLYFFPLPQEQGSLRPVFAVFMTTRPPATPFCDLARSGVNPVGNRPPPRLGPGNAGGGAKASRRSLILTPLGRCRASGAGPQVTSFRLFYA